MKADRARGGDHGDAADGRLGAALVVMTSSESIIAANFRTRSEGLYAADAALERVLGELGTVPDWTPLLGGAVQSAFVDGPPIGDRALPDGSTIDLARLLAMLNCGTITACSDGAMNQVTRDRPWGPNNPRWQLYGYGRLSDLMPTASVNSPYYVVVHDRRRFVRARRRRHPGRRHALWRCGPGQDAGDPPAWSCNPGTGVLELRAEAFGPGGAHTVVEMTIARSSAAGGQNSAAGDPQDYNNGQGRAGLRILSWREPR